MMSESDLMNLIKVIERLDGYLGNQFIDPLKIERIVEETNLNYLKKSWNKICGNLGKVYFQQKNLSNAWKTFEKVSEIFLILYFSINVPFLPMFRYFGSRLHILL